MRMPAAATASSTLIDFPASNQTPTTTATIHFQVSIRWVRTKEAGFAFSFSEKTQRDIEPVCRTRNMLSTQKSFSIRSTTEKFVKQAQLSWQRRTATKPVPATEQDHDQVWNQSSLVRPASTNFHHLNSNAFHSAFRYCATSITV